MPRSHHSAIDVLQPTIDSSHVVDTYTMRVPLSGHACFGLLMSGLIASPYTHSSPRKAGEHEPVRFGAEEANFITRQPRLSS